MNEHDIIAEIKARQPQLADGLLGIGDDAAVIPGGDEAFVMTTDMLMDGKHFVVGTHSLANIGRKCLAVNISDLAAMAASPQYALVSVALPTSFSQSMIRELWSGIQDIADEFRVKVIGGDTNVWSGGLVVNVTAVGSVEPGEVVTRSGARPGDYVCVTGSLGGSQVDDHHLLFQPRVNEAQELKKLLSPTAMMDVSDGLASDLRKLCEASSVGVNIESSQLPISDRVPSDLNEAKRIEACLSDGEDFELLFTCHPNSIEMNSDLSIPITKIGQVTAGGELKLDSQPLELQGYVHKFDA